MLNTLRPYCDVVGDRRTQQLFHWPCLEAIAGQIAVLRNPLEQFVLFEVAADALRRDPD